MAYISQVKLPNGDLYNLKDSRLTGVIPVVGTQTSATGSWTGNIDIPALFDGLTIAYYLPYDGNSDATLNLTLSDNTTTGAIAVYSSGNERTAAHYNSGSTIILTYWSAGSINVAGQATTQARWIKAETTPPSASDVGAIPTPVSASSGDFLVYNGTAWTAQSLSTWQGGSY